MFLVPKSIIALGAELIAFWLAMPVSANPANGNNAPALTNWQAATSSFQKAGRLIGQDNYGNAKIELSAGTTNLSPPYNTMASQFLAQLEAALKLSTNRSEPSRRGALMELCNDLRAHKAALHKSKRCSLGAV